MSIVQHNTKKSNLITQIRANLYQLPQGQLVGFGPEHPGGYGFCYNCSEPECEHVEAITQAWLDGASVEVNSIPFNGEPVPYTSNADDYGLEPVL